MNEKIKCEWEELIRSDVRVYGISSVLRSIRFSNDFIGGPKYEKILVYIKDGTAYYYENFGDHEKVGNYVLEKLRADRKFFEKYVNYWKERFNHFIELLEEFRKLDLKKLTDEEIGEKIWLIHDEYSHFHGLAYNVDTMDIMCGPIIEDLVKKHLGDREIKKSELTDIFNKITFPDTPTLTWQKEFDFLRLAELKKDGNLNDEDLEKYVDRYYWADFNWGRGKALTKKELAKNLETAAEMKTSDELLQYSNKKLEEKKQTLTELAPSEAILYILEIFETFGHLQDLRKEGQMKGMYCLDLLMEEIAKRRKIDPKILDGAWPEEVVAICKNEQFDIERIGKRSGEYFVIYGQNGKKEYFGAEASKLRDQELNFELDKSIDLQGIAASKGKVVGRALVSLGSKEAIEKIQDGEILITGMTTPDFVPAMKKAGAIVTDEGGLTCHAAIISRELNIPCVVGTKYATRIIASGDKVEVNANHGVIKKI